MMREIIVGRTHQSEADYMIRELEFYKGWKLKKRHDFKNGNCIFSMTRGRINV
jgi:hypothetical protein